MWYVLLLCVTIVGRNHKTVTEHVIAGVILKSPGCPAVWFSDLILCF